MKIISNKKGSYSIISIILIFISLLAITAYVDMLTKTYTLNEVQEIMDTTGISVLQTLVDDKRLKEEMLAFNAENYMDYFSYDSLLGNYEGQLYSRYKESLKLAIGNNPTITHFEITGFDAYFEKSTWGLGQTGRVRPQIGLDVVAIVRIKTSPYFDTAEFIERYFYNARSNNNIIITYNGKTKNGESELIIRSFTRMVYR